MDKVLKELLEAPGISGCEEAVAEIMKRELSKYCDLLDESSIDEEVISNLTCDEIHNTIKEFEDGNR